MRIVGNLLWVIFGGALIALLWFVVALLCCCTIIFIPIGVQCFKFAKFILWPFSYSIEISDSSMNMLFNLIWILLFGWELCLCSFVVGCIWCLTIIGIPFGLQWFRFALISFLPFGSTVSTIR